jgi:signal transduction histidine kinase/ActR/RegA family two-component response regulator
MTVEYDPPRMRARRFWIPLTVLLLSLAATAVSAALALRATNLRDTARFENAVDSSREAITNRLEIYTNMLRAGSGLFSADDFVTRSEFNAFVDRLDLQQRYPGIQGIGFTAHVPRENAGQLVERMRGEGFEDFRLWPETEGPAVDAIVYLEPLDERNRAAIGYNMASEPTRREAMLRARDTGVAAASGMVTLVQEIDEEKQAGFLIYVPIYRVPQPPATVSARQDQLRGFIYSPFRAGDLFEGIFGEVQPRVNFAIYDGAARAERLLYDSSPTRVPGYRPRFSTQETIDVAGRPWVLEFTTRPEFDAASSRSQVLLILIGGILFSAALFWMSLRQARARAEAVALFEEAQTHRRAAEEANRTKDDFLATVSHELRTPMASIVGWSSLLAEGDLPEEEVRVAVEAIHRSSRVQAELIDDLLDLSRISSGKLDVNPTAADLSELVRTAVHSIQHTAAEKRLPVELQSPNEKILVWGDPKRLNQIFLNLLSNAVKFTDEGFVRTRLVPSGDQVFVEIEDSGIGLDPDFLPHLFQRFKQADASSGRIHGGLGIGLSIVRHLVELHGGSVEAESPGLGKGSTFRVTLPRIDDEPEISSESVSNPGSIAGTRVLIVEDESAMREFLSTVIRHAGADVIQAAAVSEAMHELQESEIDLIISDIAMPGEDGCSMMERIRKLPDRRVASLPAIAITAYGRTWEREKILASGFDAVLQKPVEASRLMACVATVMEDGRPRDKA